MIINWRKIANEIKEDLKNKINKLCKTPEFSVILVWENQASKQYVSIKSKVAKELWIKFNVINLDKNISEEDLIIKIKNQDNNKYINWIIIQMPLPKHLNIENLINYISPEKDIDWFHPYNLWKMFRWDLSGLLPCTPKWIITLLKKYNINLDWKNVTVIWRSNLVWRPISTLCLLENATVTTCHSRTKDLKSFVKNADIVISAVWIANIIKLNMLKKDSVIIDVWCSFIYKDNKKCFVWDTDFNEIEKTHLITPVPGWVWPMTIISLLENVYIAYLLQHNLNT